MADRATENAARKPLKILVLNYEYPPIGGGGGTVCKNLAEECAARGHEVRVQTSWIKGLDKREEHPRISVYRSFSFRRKADTCTVPQMFLFLITNFWPALWHAWSWKPHVIHVHFAVPTGVLAWLVGLLSRTPYVLTVHLGDVPGALPEQTDHMFRILKPFTRPIWKGAASVVAVSEFVRKLSESAYGVPVTKIFNGIQPPMDSTTVEKASPFQILSVGRFNAQKNLFFMLEILSRIKHRNWKYLLVGDGPLREQLENRVTDLELEDHVFFTGWISQDRVNQMMKESHLLLMPSLAEGLPMVGISALFAGLPIFGSKIDGLTDLINPGTNGFLIPLDSPEQWTQQIERALTSPHELKPMGKKSLAIADDFDIKKVAKDYENLFYSNSKNR